MDEGTDDEIELIDSVVGEQSLCMESEEDLTPKLCPSKKYLCVVGHRSGSGVNCECLSRGVGSTAVMFQMRLYRSIKSRR